MEAGAVVLDSSNKWTSPSNLLKDDRNAYSMTPCAEPKKYVTIGLSEESLVDAVYISSFEKYSSHFKKVNILGSAKFPTTEWVWLGDANLEDESSAEQTIQMKRPSWCKYIKLRMVSHHGDEFYCTLTSVQGVWAAFA